MLIKTVKFPNTESALTPQTTVSDVTSAPRVTVCQRQCQEVNQKPELLEVSCGPVLWGFCCWRADWTPVPAELSQWFCRTDYQLSRHRKPSPNLSAEALSAFLFPLLFFSFFFFKLQLLMKQTSAANSHGTSPKPTRTRTEFICTAALVGGR